MKKLFTGDDRDYTLIQKLKKGKQYVFATCYDVTWGFLLPCKSGVVWEQQTDGVCCHHVYVEGVLIPLGNVVESKKVGEVWKHERLIDSLPNLNYEGKSVKRLWRRIKTHSHIDFEFTHAPSGMPPSQEGFQWVIYHGHQEGWGQSFNINAWKEKPIVLIYPNCD